MPEMVLPEPSWRIVQRWRDPKKNVWSLRIGPPAVPPNWFSMSHGDLVQSRVLVEVAQRVQPVVVVKPVCGSMEIVGSALRDHVHHRARGPAVLGQELAGHQLEFFHEVGVVHAL